MTCLYKRHAARGGTNAASARRVEGPKSGCTYSASVASATEKRPSPHGSVSSRSRHRYPKPRMKPQPPLYVVYKRTNALRHRRYGALPERAVLPMMSPPSPLSPLLHFEGRGTMRPAGPAGPAAASCWLGPTGLDPGPVAVPRGSTGRPWLGPAPGPRPPRLAEGSGRPNARRIPELFGAQRSSARCICPTKSDVFSKPRSWSWSLGIRRSDPSRRFQSCEGLVRVVGVGSNSSAGSEKIVPRPARDRALPRFASSRYPTKSSCSSPEKCSHIARIAAQPGAVACHIGAAAMLQCRRGMRVGLPEPGPPGPSRLR